jgi:hypothetical protein
MKRRVIVVDGPLAFRMRRVEAARASVLGLEVLSLPLLAARLAGGFRRFADRDLLAPAIAEALGRGNFKDIDSVRGLPGMVRAVMQTLDRVWTADLPGSYPKSSVFFKRKSPLAASVNVRCGWKSGP